MIIWSDERRALDYGVFCREASNNLTKSTVIVSDIRRKTDIKWFKETFGNKIKLIRIKCDDSVRIARGWKFQEGIDDIQSECDLDEWKEWDLSIENDGKKETDEILFEILKFVGI
jgi:phosphomevalonate kinase